MKKNVNLVPISNLESLNEDERRAYLVHVSDYYGLPIQMNLLEFMYMEGGDGKRNLVLYAKKGATDMLRDKRGISVTDTKETITDSYAMITVKGQDKTGRTEMAIGVANLSNLKDSERPSRIMVAQTRACRRLTLQFVGCGFLDDSEVHQVTTSLGAVSTPISEIANQPVPVMNATAPKLVSPSVDTPESQTEPVATPELVAAITAIVTANPQTLTDEQMLGLPELTVDLMPTAEEYEAFGVRYAKLRDKVLPRAGLVPTEGFGGVPQKVSAFVCLRYRINHIRKLTVNQWEELLTFLETTDPVEVITLIDKATAQ